MKQSIYLILSVICLVGMLPGFYYGALLGIAQNTLVYFCLFPIICVGFSCFFMVKAEEVMQ
jgi:hypothetical protein